MKKILFVLAVLTITTPNLASAQPERQSCVVQVLKKDTPAARANFIIACGSETLLSYRLPPLENRNAVEVLKVKSQFVEILRGLVGHSPNVTCMEQESELFWIALCYK